MPSRVCTSDGGQRRSNYIGGSIMKVRRTRRAPDFYSPETPSKHSRLKKTHSDDNDSWKPESETDDNPSESDSEKSHSKRDKTGSRRKSLRRSSAVNDDDDDDDRTGTFDHEEKDDQSDDESGSDEDLSIKNNKGDFKKKEKKAKGCRELQDLLDGCAQVHKESRTRRLPPRHNRSTMINGQSESTWSNASSRAVTEKDSGNMNFRSQHQNSSKRQSSLTSSSAQGERKYIDSSTENPVITELTETVEDQPADTLSKRPTSIVKNLTGDERIRQNKTELDMDDPSVRVKRQRLDSDPSQLRKTTQSTENGEINQTTSTRDVEEETPHFKLPRMPMIRYGQYWYRARIKQESRDRIYVEFTGFEDGRSKPFWIRKDSEDVFKGSYSGKDWKHIGEGAWIPKPRKIIKKVGQRGGRRKKRRGGFIRGGDSREHNQRTTQGISFSDQAFTADSEGYLKTGLNENGDHGGFRKSNLASTSRPYDSVRQKNGLQKISERIRTGAKSLDRGSESDVFNKDQHSDESFPNLLQEPSKSTQTRSQKHNAKHKGSPTANGNKTMQGTSFFGHAASGSSHGEDCTIKDCQVCKTVNPIHGNRLNDDPPSSRLRRKSAKPMEKKDEAERTRTQGSAILRRSTRKVLPKEAWKLKDSSSDLESLEEAPNTSISRRNGGTTRSKYTTRSKNSEPPLRGNSGAFSSSHCQRPMTSKPQRSILGHPLVMKKTKKPSQRVYDGKDLEEDGDFLFETEDVLDARLVRSRQDHLRVYPRPERERRSADQVNGVTMWSMSVNVLSQIRKYVPYYTDHIPDARLSGFMELMERLDGIGMDSYSPDKSMLPPPGASFSQSDAFLSNRGQIL